MDGGAVILVYILGGLLAAGILVMFWMWARSTRKKHVCPKCGERVVVEQMTARTCPTCGAQLSEGRPTH